MPEQEVKFGINFQKSEYNDFFKLGVSIASYDYNGERALYLSLDLGFIGLEIGRVIKDK